LEARYGMAHNIPYGIVLNPAIILNQETIKKGNYSHPYLVRLCGELGVPVY